MKPSIVLALLLPLTVRAAETVVTLTFDDSLESQFQAGQLLESYGVRGTFYVNSSRLDEPKYMTKVQLHRLEEAGHEIGGHTVTHAELPKLEEDEQRRQICLDRSTLLAMGFKVTSLAYPFGQATSASARIAQECGYNSARIVGNLRTRSCPGCPAAELIPPAAPYQIRSPPSADTSTTAEAMKQMVLDAEAAGGGWVPLVFHYICDGCNQYSTHLETLRELVEWLAQRKAQGTVVKTVHEVIGGSLAPAVMGPPPPPNLEGNLLRNPSLEDDDDGDGIPDCWQRSGSGENTFAWSRSEQPYDGAFSERLEISSFNSGARRLVSRQDLGACSPSIEPGQSYRLSTWYSASSTPRFVAYYRTAVGAWRYWTQSEKLPTSDTYVFHQWSTPEAPADAVAISVGLSLYDIGSLLVDDFKLGPDVEVAPAPEEGCGCGTSSSGSLGFIALLAGLAIRSGGRQERARRSMS